MPALVPAPVPCIPDACPSQCDRCHDLDNCVPATRQRGELLLCTSCAGLWDLSVEVFDMAYGSEVRPPDPDCVDCGHKVRLHARHGGCTSCPCKGD